MTEPELHTAEISFSGEGRSSPKTIWLAELGPRFVTVMVKVTVCPRAIDVLLALSVMTRSAPEGKGVAWAAQADSIQTASGAIRAKIRPFMGHLLNKPNEFGDKTRTNSISES